MKIYVASSWRNDWQQGVVSLLRTAGHEVYDFKNPGLDNHGFHWSEIDPNWLNWTPDQFRKALTHPIAGHGFACDMDALTACDVCVLVLPSGRSAHLEAGWAAGAGKPVLIFMPRTVEPELIYRMTDGIVFSNLELLDRLTDLAPSFQPPEVVPADEPYAIAAVGNGVPLAQDTTTASCGAKSSEAPRLDLIPRAALVRLAARLQKGESRYGRGNWRKGLSDVEYVRERAAHVLNHTLLLIGKLEGSIPDDGDDDAGAIMWGGMFLCEATEALKKPAEQANG